jgi:N-acetylneuraminic acid mutarotase
LAAVELGGLIYAIGGVGNGTATEVEAFDPVAGSWTIKPSMSFPRAQFAAVAVNGRIYVLGGQSTVLIEAFDPVANAWDVATRLPVGHDPYRAAVIGDSIYYIGSIGTVLTPSSRAVVYWDTILDRWGESIPLKGSHEAMVSLDGSVYAFGGQGTNSVELLTGATRLFVHRKD